jgi:predicted dehydrogenase/nucleoside-diphosphate-sugar epimerase
MNKKIFSFDDKLKIGIIGCGRMGRHHIRAINLMDNAQITAIVDPLVERNDIGNLIPEKAKIFSTPVELFNTTAIDVAHIVTPPATHAELAQLALNNGAHVYVEKPFTLHKSEAEAIYSLAEKKGLRVCAGHQVLFEKPALIVKQCLNDIGKLIHIDSYFSFRTVRRNTTPVDQLIDILPHPVCLLLNFMDYTADSAPEIQAMSTDAKGEVRAILRNGDTYGTLNVTLRGRPVESYVRIIGTNGSFFADFVRGTVIKLPGPGSSALSVVYNTYSQAAQGMWKPTCFFAGQALKKHKSYPGLAEIINAYYTSIFNQTPFPISSESTIHTVSLCEKISEQLRESEARAEQEAKIHLEAKEKNLPPLVSDNEVVLVTGGTGMLGRKVAEELRSKGRQVRILARKIPPFSGQLPGVEYYTADLGEEIPATALSNVSVIVHCASETSGGKKEHERNTIQATRNIIETAAKSGVKHFIHISSIAVLKTSKEIGGPIDENTPLDLNNLERGPYVWGKAEAERQADMLGNQSGIHNKIIRLGPLIDFSSFQAPGRLGKEAGPFFVAVGSKKSKLSMCDVHTAARVIRYYIEKFEEAPQILNLVEPEAPTRGELADLLKKSRPDLKFVWLPIFILKAASPFLKLLQRMLLPGRKPIDLVAVFSTEPYNTNLAAEIIKKAS